MTDSKPDPPATSETDEKPTEKLFDSQYTSQLWEKLQAEGLLTSRESQPLARGPTSSKRKEATSQVDKNRTKLEAALQKIKSGGPGIAEGGAVAAGAAPVLPADGDAMSPSGSATKKKRERKRPLKKDEPSSIEGATGEVKSVVEGATSPAPSSDDVTGKPKRKRDRGQPASVVCSFHDDSGNGVVCKQRAILGFHFCIRHILLDPEAPYQQCSHKRKPKCKKDEATQCTNAIRKDTGEPYCSTHLIMQGLKEAKKKSSSASACSPDTSTTSTANSDSGTVTPSAPIISSPYTVPHSPSLPAVPPIAFPPAVPQMSLLQAALSSPSTRDMAPLPQLAIPGHAPFGPHSQMGAFAALPRSPFPSSSGGAPSSLIGGFHLSPAPFSYPHPAPCTPVLSALEKALASPSTKPLVSLPSMSLPPPAPRPSPLMTPSRPAPLELGQSESSRMITSSPRPAPLEIGPSASVRQLTSSLRPAPLEISQSEPPRIMLSSARPTPLEMDQSASPRMMTSSPRPVPMEMIQSAQPATASPVLSTDSSSLDQQPTQVKLETKEEAREDLSRPSSTSSSASTVKIQQKQPQPQAQTPNPVPTTVYADPTATIRSFIQKGQPLSDEMCQQALAQMSPQQRQAFARHRILMAQRRAAAARDAVGEAIFLQRRVKVKAEMRGRITAILRRMTPRARAMWIASLACRTGSSMRLNRPFSFQTMHKLDPPLASKMFRAAQYRIPRPVLRPPIDPSTNQNLAYAAPPIRPSTPLSSSSEEESEGEERDAEGAESAEEMDQSQESQQQRRMIMMRNQNRRQMIFLRQKRQQRNMTGPYRNIPQVDHMCRAFEDADFDKTDLFPLGLEPSDDEDDVSTGISVNPPAGFSSLGETDPQMELYLMKKQLRLEKHGLFKTAQLNAPLMNAAKKFPTACGAALLQRKSSEPPPAQGLPNSIRRCCQVESKVRCERACLPMSNQCSIHVLYNVNQRMFSFCTQSFCRRPVHAVDVFLWDGKCKLHRDHRVDKYGEYPVYEDMGVYAESESEEGEDGETEDEREEEGRGSSDEDDDVMDHRSMDDEMEAPPTFGHAHPSVRRSGKEELYGMEEEEEEEEEEREEDDWEDDRGEEEDDQDDQENDGDDEEEEEEDDREEEEEGDDQEDEEEEEERVEEDEDEGDGTP